MNENIKALKEVSKGVQMGMNSISYISEKVENDTKFKNALNHEYSMYNNISDEVNKIFSNYGEIPGKFSLKDEAMLWSGIQLNTIKDSSTSKLSELLVQGTTMGIIEGKRLLNKNKNVLGTDVKNLLNNFVKFHEDSVEHMKEFL